MRQEGTLPEMQELAEQIGEFIHYWGFKRIHGKIWTHLFLAERPLDAADLVRQMKISKALVSISLRELMEYEVIEEVGKSARGTHLYRPNPDILKVILAVLRSREKRMLTRIQAAAEALERTATHDRQDNELSDKALGQLGALVTKAQMGLENFISLRSVDFGEWRQAFITTDLKEEAELRSKSVVAPSSRRKDESDVESSPVSGGTSSMSSGVSAAAVSPTASDTPPVLSSGQGIGFRIYK